MFQNGDLFPFATAATKVSVVDNTVKAALNGDGAAPSVACDADTDFARRWLQAADPKSRLSAIFDGVCLKSGTTSCWSNFFSLIKSSSAANVAAQATQSCTNACAIAAAGKFATYFPAAADSKE
jgi:hypothetical protein